jgi:hypothetical protein
LPISIRCGKASGQGASESRNPVQSAVDDISQASVISNLRVEIGEIVNRRVRILGDAPPIRHV